MAVRCMNEETKLALFMDIFDNSMSNVQAAAKYGVSTRTVGRVVNEVAEKTQIPSDETEEEYVDMISDPENEDDDELSFFDDGEEGEDDIEEYEFGVYIDDEDEDEELGFLDRGEDESYTFIMTPDSISITRILDDDVDTINIDEEHEKFEDVYQMIMSNPRDEDTIKKAYALVSIKLRYESVSNGTVTVIPEEGMVRCNIEGYDIKVSGRLADRLIDASIHEDEGRLNGLMAFTEKLMDNPSPRSVKELYEFLEAADIVITEDGLIECFKKVTENFRDCYTGNFDNSVGKTVFQPRFTVNDDSSQTCAEGLHVCSYAYLNSYPGSKIIKVLVDPADVVSIPNDYYSLDGSGNVKAKARVCRYKVVKDVTEEYERFAR